MKKLILICSLFFLCYPDTTIVDTKVTPSYILSIVDKNSLVLFDIDFTLLQPLLFSIIHLPIWLQIIISHFIAQSTHESMKHSFLKSLIEQYIVPFLAQLRKFLIFTPTDVSMVKLINQLQEKNIPTLALTARMPIHNGSISYQQLTEIGINFAHSSLGSKKISLPAPLLYNNGIIFTSGKDKGEAIKEFIESAKIKPTQIILIDDFLKNINDASKVAEELHIPFIGIRYAYIESH